jgi:hypothetical protein
MSDMQKAVETQLNNIQAKTGKSLAELEELVKQSGLTRHSELRQMLQNELGLGYGDANSLVHYVLKSDGARAAEAQGATIDDVLAQIYSGSKADLRPIHEKLMNAIQSFGAFETAPKKNYVSLRRKRQFAMLGPATNTRFELGLNIKDLPEDARLHPQPAGSMCNYKVKLTSADEVDDEMIGWVRQAYEAAG